MTQLNEVITLDLARELIATAGRAPSLHNSQPWRFRLEGAALELRIDPQRAMRVSDPEARELVISCGAALYNLQLALRGKALVPHVDIAPARGDPLLLARIVAEPGPGPTPDEQRLLASVVHRHTHRHGFSAVPIAQTLASAFETDVAAEGARLVWVDEPDRVRALVELALLADGLQGDDPEWQAEIARWVDTTGRGRRDGIPIAAVPQVPTPRSTTDRLPARSFVPGRSPRVHDHRPGAVGRIAVLVTKGDQLADWIAAGQALQRMLLRAADDWVFATYATAPLEVPFLREAVRETLGLRDQPQMLLELGHASCASITPRLPADEKLDR